MDKITERIKVDAEVQHARLVEHAESERDIAYAQGFSEGWHEGATAENERAQKLVDALAELVELKRLKEECGRTNDYMQRQPVAWAKAATVLQQFKDGKKEVEEPKPEGWPWICEHCGKQDCESDHK